MQEAMHGSGPFSLVYPTLPLASLKLLVGTTKTWALCVWLVYTRAWGMHAYASGLESIPELSLSHSLSFFF